MNILINILLICILIFILFFYFNKYLKNYNQFIEKEHFINIYQFLNDGFTKNMKENNQDISIKKDIINFDNIYYKNIYLSYSKKTNQCDFYLLNYQKKLFMKINLKKDKSNFDIYDENRKKIGFLKSRYHNKYIIDLFKLYKNDYIFYIINNYNKIKIYNDFDYNVFYLIKNNDELKKYKLLLFDEEIGYINSDNQNYKFFIKKDYLKYTSLFSYALIILIINKQN